MRRQLIGITHGFQRHDQLGRWRARGGPIRHLLRSPHIADSRIHQHPQARGGDLLVSVPVGFSARDGLQIGNVHFASRQPLRERLGDRAGRCVFGEHTVDWAITAALARDAVDHLTTHQVDYGDDTHGGLPEPGSLPFTRPAAATQGPRCAQRASYGLRAYSAFTSRRMAAWITRSDSGTRAEAEGSYPPSV